MMKICFIVKDAFCNGARQMAAAYSDASTYEDYSSLPSLWICVILDPVSCLKCWFDPGDPCWTRPIIQNNKQNRKW